MGRNEAVVVGPDGKQITRYQKIYPFSYAKEDLHYEAGEHIATFTWNSLSVTPLVCYDLRFPEVFRDAVQHGAELFVIIANWPEARIQHWITLLQARSIENQAFVVGVNRCGNDPFVSYPGQSMIISPQGNIIAALDDEEGIVQAEIDSGDLREYREQFPALKDMIAP
jgi:predicted amidohydrolase